MSLSRAMRSVVLDAVAVAAIAVITMQALRRWCGDRYLVPSGSMEPLLHGDPAHGDVVFVDKLARASAQKRGDLVVVQDPRDGKQQLVKRIAACGDDKNELFINIVDGDVWLGPDSQRMHRVQKDPLAARSQRATWASAPGSAASSSLLELGALARAGDAGPWSFAPAAESLDEAKRLFARDVRIARHRGGAAIPAGCAGTRRAVDAGYVDATGARGAVGNDWPVTDVGLDVEIAAAPETVLAAIETRHEALVFTWEPATGRVVLWRDGEQVAAATFATTALPARVEFGLLDDRAFFCIAGDAERLLVHARHPEWNTSDVPVRTWVCIGGVGAADARLVLRSLLVFRDVYAWKGQIIGMPGQPTWPQEVPAGHWFLLGDSAFDSHDSRNFGAVPMNLFLGSPRCVLGPWPRMRWVP